MAEQGSAALGEELTRLVSAAQNWLRDALPPAPDGPTPAECQWCPLCQLVTVLRGDRPEVTERVTEAGAALLLAVRSITEHAHQPTTAEPTTDEPAAHGPEPTARRVQHVDLD